MVERFFDVKEVVGSIPTASTILENMESKNKTVPSDTLTKLTHLRDDFSDEIPKELITSATSNNKYKVRVAWWTGLLAGLENAVSEGLVETDKKELVEHFVEKEYERLQKNAKTDSRTRTTVDDLKRANKILDIVLSRQSKI